MEITQKNLILEEKKEEHFTTIDDDYYQTEIATKFRIPKIAVTIVPKDKHKFQVLF